MQKLRKLIFIDPEADLLKNIFKNIDYSDQYIEHQISIPEFI